MTSPSATPDETSRWRLELMPLLRFPGDLLRVLATITGRPLPNALRERIMLAVTGQNRCAYCEAVHREFGAASGLSSVEIARLLEGDLSGLPEEDRAAVAFACELSRHGFGDDVRPLEAQTAALDEAGRRAIEASARVIDLANRIANTFELAMQRLSGRLPAGRIDPVDLVSGALLFLPVVAFITPIRVLVRLLRRGSGG